MNIFKRLTERFSKVQPLPEGLHHYQAPAGDKEPYRLHLRLRQDGSGLLVVNASTVLHLNPTAAEYAYHMIKGSTPEQAGAALAARYRIKASSAKQDYHEFMHRIETLISTPDLDPVSFLDFERVTPHSADLTAPLRLDCALTYRLPAGADPLSAPHKNVSRELTTEEWKSVLSKAWLAGIPHVTFTGGEPTLRDDLPALVDFAEQTGQVTGLLTDGLKLADPTYLQVLLQTGLDHLMLVLRPEADGSWKAVEKVMPEDIFTTVHLTITPANAAGAASYLDRLVKMHVRSVSLSISDPSLETALHALRERSAELDLSLAWNLPVPYSELNPVALELDEEDIPEGAGKVWMYVEPDGDVLPAQGRPDAVLGNILADPWEKIFRP